MFGISLRSDAFDNLGRKGAE